MTTIMDQAREEQTAEYKAMLHNMVAPGGEISMADHPGAQYLATGYGQGFIHGYQTNAGAAHAGLSVTIGGIDSGALDLIAVKEQLIQLRNAIKEAAGL